MASEAPPSSAGVSEVPRSSGRGQSLQEEIVYMEAQTWEGMKTSSKQMLPFLTPDCIMVFPGAAIIDSHSEPSLREILTRPDVKPWTSYEMTEVHVLALAKGAASITYEVEARRQDEHYEAMVTSIWRRDDEGEWKMCLHQQTPINVI